MTFSPSRPHTRPSSSPPASSEVRDPPRHPGQQKTVIVCACVAPFQHEMLPLCTVTEGYSQHREQNRVELWRTFSVSSSRLFGAVSSSRFVGLS